MLDVRVRKRLAAFELDVAILAESGVLVLFGPSGAGKTMLLRAIAGVGPVDAGRISLGDRVLLDTERGISLHPRQRRVGYVPQHYALFPHLSALDNVAYSMVAGRGWRRAEARARAHGLLERVGLGERAAARPGQLSGGQQQRVALARAVAADPEVLLLDEPLAALDMPTRLELRELLQVVQRDLAVPVVFVTHDLEEAVTVGRTMAVMVDGRVRQLDRVGRVLDAPADRTVAELLQARNILAGTTEVSGGRALVATALGRLGVASTVSPGEAVEVVIRPDMIQILADGDRLAGVDAGSATALGGVVVDLIDHGTRASAAIAVAEGVVHVGLTRGEVARLGIALGCAVTVAIPSTAIHVLGRGPATT